MTEYKIKDLKKGINDVDIVVEIDFVSEGRKGGYGDDPFVPAFVKDETGEIKMTFWGDDVMKAKPGKKVKVTKGYVTEYMGTLQLNARRENPVEFL